MKLFALLFILSCSVVLQAERGSTSIRATILDADGKLISRASLVVSKAFSDDRTVYQVAEADTKGHVHLQVPNGWYQIYAVAPNYRELAVGHELYCFGQTIELKAGLEAQKLNPATTSISVLCDYDRFDPSKKRALTRNADGTWSADISTSADSLCYSIIAESPVNPTTTITNGTTFSRLSFGLRGECRSVVKVQGGIVHLVFDPKSLPSTSGSAHAEFTDALTKREVQILQNDYVHSQKHISALSADAAQQASLWDIQSIRNQASAEIAAEREPELKRLRMLCWLRLNALRNETDAPSKTFIDSILQSIAPNSALWQWSPECVMWAVRKSSNPEGEYGYKVKNDHPSEWVRQIVATDQGTTTRKETALNALIANVQRMKAMQAQAANQGALQADEIGAIRRGAPLPSFSFETLENNGSQMTNDSLKGKWVLVDNWATWCGPCVREMPALHAAYEAYKGKNFTILSVSFDRQKEDIIKYRASKYAMPWLQCYSPGVWQNEAAKIFEARSIPKPILVGPDGIIRAIGVELRGANLEQTLAKFIR